MDDEPYLLPRHAGQIVSMDGPRARTETDLKFRDLPPGRGSIIVCLGSIVIAAAITLDSADTLLTVVEKEITTGEMSLTEAAAPVRRV